MAPLRPLTCVRHLETLEASRCRGLVLGPRPASRAAPGGCRPLGRAAATSGISALAKLSLALNSELGRADFSMLAHLTSLCCLELHECGLRAVPASFSPLTQLEILSLDEMLAPALGAAMVRRPPAAAHIAVPGKVPG